jgi:hypothetical protein
MPPDDRVPVPAASVETMGANRSFPSATTCGQRTLDRKLFETDHQQFVKSPIVIAEGWKSATGTGRLYHRTKKMNALQR